MQYLKHMSERVNFVDENDFEYINILNRPEFIYGTTAISGKSVDFYKYTARISEEILDMNERTRIDFQNQSSASSGCRLRFITSSHKVVFKVSLKREWDYSKMTLWNSSGFDVYEINGEEYKHRTVFGPKTGQKMFAEILSTSPGKGYCIFLPNYNVINELYIGIEKGSQLLPFPYKHALPIIFYGNSITQGASASRSGNSTCNIVSRQLNSDVVNLSTSSSCKGQQSVAILIGRINSKAIVIDYTRNAYDIKSFKETYERFYNKVRYYHPHIPIILMTTSNFHDWKGYYGYDDVDKETYAKAIIRKENTYLINQRDLFNGDDYDLVAVDGIHYTDYGMYKIAKEIVRILKEQ
ncbi:MAG: SGNH/GDSL hydrolase family protein [Agathobacter sp.]